MPGKALCTVGFEIPLTSAAPRTVQWVAAFGLRDEVRLSNTALCSSSTERGRPLCRSSYGPATRCSIKPMPLPDCCFGPLKPLGDLGIALLLCQPKHDVRAGNESQSGGRRIGPDWIAEHVPHRSMQTPFWASDRHTPRLEPLTIMSLTSGTLH